MSWKKDKIAEIEKAIKRLKKYDHFKSNDALEQWKSGQVKKLQMAIVALGGEELTKWH